MAFKDLCREQRSGDANFYKWRARYVCMGVLEGSISLSSLSIVDVCLAALRFPSRRHFRWQAVEVGDEVGRALYLNQKSPGVASGPLSTICALVMAPISPFHL